VPELLQELTADTGKQGLIQTKKETKERAIDKRKSTRRGQREPAAKQ
jgi:hypothetical protein